MKGYECYAVKVYKNKLQKIQMGWGRCASPRSAFGIQVCGALHYKIYQRRKRVGWGVMLYGVVYASSIAIERQLVQSTYSMQKKSYIYFFSHLIQYYYTFPYKLLSAANESGKDVPSTLLKITPS